VSWYFNRKFGKEPCLSRVCSFISGTGAEQKNASFVQKPMRTSEDVTAGDEKWVCGNDSTTK
jgi:hypothetical protein